MLIDFQPRQGYLIILTNVSAEPKILGGVLLSPSKDTAQPEEDNSVDQERRGDHGALVFRFPPFPLPALPQFSALWTSAIARKCSPLGRTFPAVAALLAMSLQFGEVPTQSSYPGYDFSGDFSLDAFFSKHVPFSVAFRAPVPLSFPQFPDTAFLKAPRSTESGDVIFLTGRFQEVVRFSKEDTGWSRKALSPVFRCDTENAYALEPGGVFALRGNLKGSFLATVPADHPEPCRALSAFAEGSGHG